MKTRIITLLLAIFAIIGSASAQEYDRKVDLYKNGAVLESYDITDVDSIKFRRIDYVKAEYKVLPSGAGNVTIDGSTTTPKYVVPGTNVTYVATAKSGYKFKGWNMEGIEISTSNTLILPINSNTEITAVFQNIPNYSVTVVSSGNGTVSSSSSSVQEGGSVTLTATPNSGYVFKNWTLNGNVVSTQNPYTATVTANSVYVANFEKTYTISVSSGGGGTAVASKSSVQGGGSVTLTATPNSGYVFKNWTLNGNVVSTQNPYTATVTANSVYVANFKVAEWYRIKDLGTGYYLNAGNYTAHPDGTVGGVNVVAYAESDDQIFTFTQSGSNYILTTKSGYNIVCQQWNVDALTSAGTALTFVDNGNGTYYIMNGSDYFFKVEKVDGVYYTYCDAPSSRKATWILEQVGEDVPYTISVSSGEGGTAVASKSSVQGGGSVTLTATPNSGYVFKNWTLNGNVVSTNNPYTATVLSNSIYIANFEKIYTVSVSSTTGGTAVASKSSVQGGGSVTLTATPNEGYKFVNWTVNGEVVSTENPYIATITANRDFVANFKEGPYNNGHEYVDLGLPSGIKWATCNVGANSPEEYGDYFAWGETAPKTTYNWSTYKYCNGTLSSLTKYCTKSSYGTVDYSTTLDLSDDAAYVNWGGKWRMPTRAEYDELKNTSNCTWEWITQNGVNGYKVISKINGNSIFLPATGYRHDGNLSNAGRDGNYYSGSLSADDSYCAYHFSFNSVWMSQYDDAYRCHGHTVRAVCK